MPHALGPYYPIYLDIKNKPVLVIGGGKVAAEKLAGLYAAEASVTIVSPALLDEVRAYVASGWATHLQRPWQESDLDSDWVIVMVATDDGAVNAAVAAGCRERRIWVNAADDPKNCTFILPAVVRKGNITIGISTAGSSPALARRLREEISLYLTDELEALADLLAEVRQDLRQMGLRVDGETWQRAITPDLRWLLVQKRFAEATCMLKTALKVPDVVLQHRS